MVKPQISNVQHRKCLILTCIALRCHSFALYMGDIQLIIPDETYIDVVWEVQEIHDTFVYTLDQAHPTSDLKTKLPAYQNRNYKVPVQFYPKTNKVERILILAVSQVFKRLAFQPSYLLIQSEFLHVLTKIWSSCNNSSDKRVERKNLRHFPKYGVTANSFPLILHWPFLALIITQNWARSFLFCIGTIQNRLELRALCSNCNHTGN